MGIDSIDWIGTQPGYHAYLITHDGTTVLECGVPASETGDVAVTTRDPSVSDPLVR